MKIFKWLICHRSARKTALSLYKRGMAKARKRDHLGAIDAYSTAIKMADAPPDVKAMILYNRALVNVAVGDTRQGVDDLDAILAMAEAPINVRTMARQKLLKIDSRAHESNV